MAFKKHAVLGFWKAALMKDSKTLTGKDTKGAMGNLGRIESIEDLPKDAVLLKWINEAKKLNDSGVKLIRSEKPKHERKEYKMHSLYDTEFNQRFENKVIYDNYNLNK